jgi:hypothetical protein
MAPHLRFEFPPMVTPLLRVMELGLATPPGHRGVSIAT